MGRRIVARLPRIGLLTEKDGDDQRTLRESGDEERLNKNLTGCTWIATYGFTSLEADESEGDGGAESGTCDGDVTCHVCIAVMCLVFFESLHGSLPWSDFQKG